MGYGRALLQRDTRREEESLQKKAKKKSLWGSIGRTVGGLGAMALTGGAVNPVTLGLLTGGASYLGGAIGAKASKTGDLSKQGKFFKSDRESLQTELGAFGTQNLMSSLRSGITAGIGQKLKLAKAGAPETAKLSEGFGMDFEGSMVGRGVEKVKQGGTDLMHNIKQVKSDILYGGDRTAASREISKGLKNYQFGSGVEGRTEPWQESLFGGVDSNIMSALPDKEVSQGMHDGWLESLQPSKRHKRWW